MVQLQDRDYEARDELLRTITVRIEENFAAGKVVASLGMAVYEPDSDKTFHEVFKRADALMYERMMQLKGMGAVTRDRPVGFFRGV